MNLLNVLYYNYFLFYKKILKETEPHFATVVALSAGESFIINGILDLISLKCFCFLIPVWIQFGITILIIYCNYLLFHRNGKVKKIIISKPTIGNSKGLSIAITLIFFLATTSWLFWGPIYGKYLLSLCR